jgi:hypothetical protein
MERQAVYNEGVMDKPLYLIPEYENLLPKEAEPQPLSELLNPYNSAVHKVFFQQRQCRTGALKQQSTA